MDVQNILQHKKSKDKNNNTKEPPRFSLDEIAKMAIQYKIPIFPCKNDKTPAISGWQEKACYEPKTLKEWQEDLSNFSYWGMPTNRFFALDLDGKNYGKVKDTYLKDNIYTQETRSKGSHWLFKNKNKEVRNKAKFTGDFDIRGDGGYICLYKPIFSEFATPENVPTAPKELLDIIGKAKSKDKFEKGSRNNTLCKRIFTDLLHTKGKNIPNILEEAEQSGLEKREIIQTTKSAIKGALKTNEINKLKDLNNLNIIPGDNKELNNLKPVGWKIPGWLPTKGGILVTGDKGSGKSFFSLQIARLLSSPLEQSIFGQYGGGKKWLYCYVEGDITIHRDRWEAIGGQPDKIDYWKYNPKDKHPWTNLNKLETVLKTGEHEGIIIDRADMLIGNKETKTAVRDALLNFDNLMLKYNILGIITRHTSKPQGQDARKFTERTDGFKEWQHTPRICLYLHKTKEGVVCFKQYANDTTTDGLIELNWKKQDNGPITFLEFNTLNSSITADQIEKKYNPRGYGGQTLSKEDSDSFLVKIITKQVLDNHSRGKYKTEDYLKWAKEILGIGEKKARELLKQAGYRPKSGNGGGVIWQN